MKKIADLITEVVKDAFVQCKYPSEYGLVTLGIEVPNRM